MGKTDCTTFRHDSCEIYKHICNSNEFNFVKNMLELSPYDEGSNIKCLLTDVIFTNTKIIDKSKHWSLILFQESIAINRLKPSLNHRIKASKSLLTFNLSYLVTSLFNCTSKIQEKNTKEIRAVKESLYVIKHT